MRLRLRFFAVAFPRIVLLSVLAARPTSAGGVPASPAKFVPPPLHPRGVELETRKLAPGVFALLSGKANVDNSGFVVGDSGVLVIDAHINGAMARQIQARVREVTEKPILYLVNTNYHADHTFGNYAFPEDTRIVAHRKTADRMRAFEREKKIMMGTVDNDPEVFAGVELRLPDILFDETLTLDLGGRTVELYFFGPGNTPGDTVVYEPLSKTAWTGNLVVGEGSVPFLTEGGAGAYLETVARLASRLDTATVIPGHGAVPDPGILTRYLRYLSGLIASVRSARRAGWTLEQTLAKTPLPEAFARPPDAPFPILNRMYAGFHAYNVRRTYLELAESQAGR